MTALEKMRQWLQSYPGWKDTFTVDFTEATPGSAGLFPEGLEEVSRRTDVIGNQQIVCRYRFTLYRRTAGGSGDMGNAQWLLDLQNWVQQQSAAGLTPCFGDLPARERVYAQKGALQKRSQTPLYALVLVAEFIKVYEGG